jgi:hypothetical protein
MNNQGYAFSVLENRSLQGNRRQQVVLRRIGNDTANSGTRRTTDEPPCNEFETTGKRLPAPFGLLVINGIDRRKISLEGGLASRPVSLIFTFNNGGVK